MKTKKDTAAPAQAASDSSPTSDEEDLSWQSLLKEERQMSHRWRHFDQAVIILRPFCEAAWLVNLVLFSTVICLSLFTIIEKTSQTPAALSACAVMLATCVFYMVKFARRLDAHCSELSRIQDRIRSLESSERLRRIREIFRKTDDDQDEKDGSVETEI